MPPRRCLLAALLTRSGALQATVVATGEIVAVKKVLQDKRFKNREFQVPQLRAARRRHAHSAVRDACAQVRLTRRWRVQIMKQLRHVNIVELKNCFYTNGEKPEEVYLNLLLEFVPETVYRIIRHYR